MFRKQQCSYMTQWRACLCRSPVFKKDEFNMNQMWGRDAQEDEGTRRVWYDQPGNLEAEKRMGWFSLPTLGQTPEGEEDNTSTGSGI